LVKSFVYTFRCPVCAKFAKFDEPGEPLCTGPNEATDDHEPVLMRRVKVAHAINPQTHFHDVAPAIGEALTKGPMIMPGDLLDPDYRTPDGEKIARRKLIIAGANA
jgi:hypothetical protein